MTNNLLTLIPADYTYVPSRDAVNNALWLLKTQLFPNLRITVQNENQVFFFDAGTNFEWISCPICNEKIDIFWWQQEIDRAFSTEFRQLMVIVPCCRLDVSLNALHYEWPAGFAMFGITIHDPVAALQKRDVEALEAILKCSLKLIRAHY